MGRGGKVMSDAQEGKKTSILKITINLAVTCLISGLILACAYYITHPIAVEKAKMLEQMSMKELVPTAETFTAVNGHSGMYQAKSAGKVVAYVMSEAPKGYGGAIDMLVAVSSDGKVLNFSITSSNETPGLGSKASDAPFKNQFSGKTAADLVVTKDVSKKNNIQAMTGATITSKAVTKGVKEAVSAVADYTGGKKQ